jgi:hypothetical protein
MRKCANFSLYLNNYAPDPSESPYTWGKFYILFYQCSFPFMLWRKMCYTEITIFTLQDQGEKTGIIRCPKSHTFSKLLTGGINFRFWATFSSVLYVLCTSKTSTIQYLPLVKGMSRATSLHKRNNVLDRFWFKKKGIDQFSQVFV